jgi:hypothetical protein
MCEHGDNLRVLVWTITTRPKVGRSMYVVGNLVSDLSKSRALQGLVW